MLVVFRVVQAAAAALMTPTSLGLLLSAFPPEGRSGAVRTWTAAGGVAAALGPLIGGVPGKASWGSNLLLKPPARPIALVVRLRKTPKGSCRHRSHPPFWGAPIANPSLASVG